jgi:hypothetical protein
LFSLSFLLVSFLAVVWKVREQGVGMLKGGKGKEIVVFNT